MIENTEIVTNNIHTNRAPSYYLGGNEHQLTSVCPVRIVISKRAKENFKIYAPFIAFDQVAPGVNNYTVNEKLSS